MVQGFSFLDFKIEALLYKAKGRTYSSCGNLRAFIEI